MHELSLVANLFELLEQKAKEEKIKRITLVRLRCGAFSGVVPECFQSAFDIYKKETLASEAELILDIVQVKFQCRHCGQEASQDDLPLLCPRCGSADVTILDGTELTLVSLEAEV